MLNLTSYESARRILCVGAHSDDIEIGVGALVARIVRDCPQVFFTWVVLCAGDERGDEAEQAAHLLVPADRLHVVRHAFPDARLPAYWAEVKTAFDALRDARPDVVFVHRHGDAHQDHRLAAEFVDQTFRDTLVVGYEIPKYDGDLGQPTAYAAAAPEDLEAKLAALRSFRTQHDKRWFDDETFRGLARIRGIECASPSGYAEALYLRKWRV